MQLVTTIEEVLANCARLSGYINSADDVDNFEYAIDLIKNGTCFLPVSDGQMLGFFPSRFIGYVDNDLKKHREDEVDGRETNKAIDYILESAPLPDTQSEKYYRGFCEQLGISPNATGNFGVVRKYWPVVSVASLRMPEPGRATLIADLLEIEQDDQIALTEREQLTLARIGQGKFRRALEDEWTSCPLSGCSVRQVLRASHIKKWAFSNDKERLDPMNGLLLSANYDALFDQYLISFEADGQIVVTDRLAAEERRLLRISTSFKIALNKNRSKYMKIHRKEFDRRNK